MIKIVTGLSAIFNTKEYLMSLASIFKQSIKSKVHYSEYIESSIQGEKGVKPVEPRVAEQPYTLMKPV